MLTMRRQRANVSDAVDDRVRPSARNRALGRPRDAPCGSSTIYSAVYRDHGTREGREQLSDIAKDRACSQARGVGSGGAGVPSGVLLAAAARNDLARTDAEQDARAGVAKGDKRGRS